MVIITLAIATGFAVYALLQHDDHLMTPLELQQELNRRGPNDRDPNLVEDGIIGYKTIQAWEEAVNTQYAVDLWPACPNGARFLRGLEK